MIGVVWALEPELGHRVVRNQVDVATPAAQTTQKSLGLIDTVVDAGQQHVFHGVFATCGGEKAVSLVERVLNRTLAHPRDQLVA